MIKPIKFEILFLTLIFCFGQVEGNVFAKWSELDEVKSLVEQHYPKEVNDDQLVDGACDGLLKSLDLYSEYLSRREYQEITNDVHGRYGGVGIVIAMRGDYPKVVKVLKASPAERAGIQELDEITSINGVSCFRSTIFHIIEELRGPINSQVTIVLKRPGMRHDIAVTLERAKIIIESVRDFRVFPLDIGYIKLVEFVENSAADLDQALLELRKSGVQYLILDLRNNTGGTLDSAVQIAKKFLPAGTLIVKTAGKTPEDRGIFYADGHDPEITLPMFVLVNRYTASASEIVAGALKDNRRAKIVGEKTFGKGSVQTIFPLVSGGAVRLTTAHYMLPSGNIIDQQGIQPDIELTFPDEIEQIKEMADKKDSILEKTLEILHGTKTQK